METVADDTQWIKKFMLISKQEINSPSRINSNDIDSRLRATYDNTNNERILSEKENEFFEQRRNRMLRMEPLFASQPRLKKICKDWKNDFVDSGFRTYHFPELINNSFINIEDDLKYLINLCGRNLTNLNLYYYPLPQIMQLIKFRCPNLTSLVLRFRGLENCEDLDIFDMTTCALVSKEVESNHFDNVFSKMAYLKSLTIHWQYENTALPMTLVKSIKRVRKTLKILHITCKLEKIQSNYSVLSLEIKTLMAIIAKMTKITSVTIDLNDGFNQVHITFINDSRNKKSLRVSCSKETDTAIIKRNNLDLLETVDLGLMAANMENRFITQQLIRSMFNNTLRNLVLLKNYRSTPNSEIFKNLLKTRTLHVELTKITPADSSKLKDDRDRELYVYVAMNLNESVLEIIRSVKFHISFTD